MPIYSYKALKQGKEIISGEITASDYKDAKDLIRKMGLVPTELKEYVDTKLKNQHNSHLYHWLKKLTLYRHSKFS